MGTACPISSGAFLAAGKPWEGPPRSLRGRGPHHASAEEERLPFTLDQGNGLSCGFRRFLGKKGTAERRFLPSRCGGARIVEPGGPITLTSMADGSFQWADDGHQLGN
jgi:hypothetical protein